MEPSVRRRAVVLGETLVVADLHLGRNRTAGIDIPIQDGRDVVDRLARLVTETTPETVVLAGDVLHAFERVPQGVTDQVEALSGRIKTDGRQLVVVRGNHDTMLNSVWSGPTHETYRLDEETVVVHGHEQPSVAADRYVLGHDHPAIEIEGQRHPCLLRGPGGPDGADLLVLPAFSRLASGVAVNGMRTDDFQSPLIEDAGALAPVVVDPDAGEPLQFPSLSELRGHLD